MKVLLTDRHDGEGDFPTFPKGATVENIESSEEYNHWMSCKIDNINTFVPDVFMINNTLTREYNPTELVIDKGEVVEVMEIIYEWLYVKNKHNVYGWIPANKAVSIKNEHL